MRRKVGSTVIALMVLAAVVFLGLRWFPLKGNHGQAYRTAQVKRGDLVASISATGTIEPTVVVDVGAQVNGIIVSFGRDIHGKPVDYGSVVDENTVLAKIDDSLYAAALNTAKAQLQQAEANKVSADANVLQMRANLLLATQNWNRAKKLGPSDALAQSAYDQYLSTFEVAKANLAVSLAAVDQAKATIAQNRSALDTAKINLSYCTIKAPVRGVIIDRQVNIGQTVVSSLSASSLFLLAKDLRHIMVWVSVNEADIGSISKGQPVIFSVDAFPNRGFKGVVGKIRLNATMTQNVVTYTVEVNTDNEDGKLLPYLTANARFITGRRENVLLVPNAALRWSPLPDQIAPDAHKKGADARLRQGRVDSAAGSSAQARGTIWVEQGKFVRPIHLKTGLTDGAFTEATGGDVTDGLSVVVGERAKEAAAPQGQERSPLMPQPIGRGQRPGQGGPDTPGPGQQR